MNIRVPELSVVVLVGASGSGKSTFAKTHFKPTEIISSDYCRALVSDDENSLDATNDAFDLLFKILSIRLKRGLLTVIDATNVQPESRKHIIKVAKEFHCLTVAIILDMPEKLCLERNKQRPDRNMRGQVIRIQQQQLRKSLRNMKKEGFSHAYTFKSPEELDAVVINREQLYNNLKHIEGPFDIIGDVHGCFTELQLLLKQLNYEVTEIEGATASPYFEISHPDNRKLVFVGDLVDRGPDSPSVLKLVMSVLTSGTGYCVPGNHDMKLLNKLKGKDVQLKHGLAETVEQLSHTSPEFMTELAAFLDGLVSHYVFDHGKLVVAHAGLIEEMQGRGSGAVRSFCLYGETTGETDEFGLPIRYNWAADYRGKATMVYGHTPVPEPEWLNRTIDIDTGCVFGGTLTALRYPEKELVSQPALATYYEPSRPFLIHPDARSAQQVYDDLLDIDDVLGKHLVHTRLTGNITIREEDSIPALELMSRFAIDPRWLIYLPPTMSPSETSTHEGLLEHPKEAFDYYHKQGALQVICEEKHMGSRAIVIVCKSQEAAFENFGVPGSIGVCYTRTGRSFFNEEGLERIFLDKVKDALTASDFWERFETDWVCLDAELLPWSAKAQSLLQDQYAAVGVAAHTSANAGLSALQMAVNNGIPAGELLKKFEDKLAMAADFRQSYRNYCWPVNSVDDLKLAPFHILATAGTVHNYKPNTWHMEEIHKICKADENLLRATAYKIIDLTSDEDKEFGIKWWEEMTAKGGEGMVVKPMDFITKGNKGYMQPAIKCRGKEYLRIIYGPEYTAPENLNRLKSRGLSTKRALALKEFGLGMEALERFVAKEPLRKVHECVFGVLAMESESVDPRL